MAGTNNAINAPLPLSATQGGLGLASPTIHGIIIGQGSSAVNNVVLSAGQVLVGTTASDPSAATITGAGGITVNSTSGAIQIVGTGTGLTWVDQSSASVTMAVNTAYVSDDGASLVTLTLPSTAALGAIFGVVGKGSGLWKIAQQAGQSILFGNQTTTVGTGGYLASTLTNDVVWLVCTTANTTFTVYGSIGNITWN